MVDLEVCKIWKSLNESTALLKFGMLQIFERFKKLFRMKVGDNQIKYLVHQTSIIFKNNVIFNASFCLNMLK